MIKSPLDNYSKSSAECFVIGLCLYMAITFHNNITEAGPLKYGLGPWTPVMDRVYDPPIFTIPKINEVHKDKIKDKNKIC